MQKHFSYRVSAAKHSRTVDSYCAHLAHYKVSNKFLVGEGKLAIGTFTYVEGSWWTGNGRYRYLIVDCWTCNGRCYYLIVVDAEDLNLMWL